MIRPTPPLLELVICTYNNASMLDLALSSLARQEPSTQADWACLVVDNNCTDATADVVAEHMRAGRIPGLRLVHEPVQGLTPARLRGVVSTTAPWIGFIDDDCLLRDDWVRNGIHFALEHPTAGGFGRPCRPRLGAAAAGVRQTARLVLRGAGSRPGGADRTGPRGRRSRPSADGDRGVGVGGRALLADRVGHELTSGGDVEMSLRVAGERARTLVHACVRAPAPDPRAAHVLRVCRGNDPGSGCEPGVRRRSRLEGFGRVLARDVGRPSLPGGVGELRHDSGGDSLADESGRPGYQLELPLRTHTRLLQGGPDGSGPTASAHRRSPPDSSTPAPLLREASDGGLRRPG